MFDNLLTKIRAPGRGRGPGGQDGLDLVKTKKMRSEILNHFDGKYDLIWSHMGQVMAKQVLGLLGTFW